MDNLIFDLKVIKSKKKVLFWPKLRHIGSRNLRIIKFLNFLCEKKTPFPLPFVLSVEVETIRLCHVEVVSTILYITGYLLQFW